MLEIMDHPRRTRNSESIEALEFAGILDDISWEKLGRIWHVVILDAVWIVWIGGYVFVGFFRGLVSWWFLTLFLLSSFLRKILLFWRFKLVPPCRGFGSDSPSGPATALKLPVLL